MGGGSASLYHPPAMDYTASMKVREFRPDDAEDLPLVLHASVHAVGRKAYTQAQLEAWSPKPMTGDVFLARASDGRSVFVGVDEAEKPIAFIELEKDGHIDCFYCHPEVVGTGVGRKLYDRLEKEAVTAGLSRLYVEASETAKRFFLRQGFAMIKRRDFERQGVPIHNYLMEKNIQSGD